MAASKIRLNHAGIREILNSERVRDDLTKRAQRVLAAAKSSAPVSQESHQHYRDGLHIEQATTDRAVVRVAGDTDHDVWVEAKTGNLGRALDAARGA